MSEDVRPERPDEDITCKWCGRELLPEERERGVCQRCLRLLRGAGVSDEEIFGETRDE